MVDITSKQESLRYAKATALVSMLPNTLNLVRENQIPKGNVLETARTAGYSGVKKTSELLPLCHPMPVEWVKVNFEFEETAVRIFVEVKTMYKTGCEMEALFGASCVAMCMYDMLKPVDKTLEVNAIKLLQKTGGNTDYKKLKATGYKSTIIVISDSVAARKTEDKTGIIIKSFLQKLDFSETNYVVIPDEESQIKAQVMAACQKGHELILTTGGTGLSKRDVTPETIRPLLDREIPGIMERARNFSHAMTPYSMLSRGIAGIKENSLIITLPGSPGAVKDYLAALFPYVLHVYKVMEGERHG